MRAQAYILMTLVVAVWGSTFVLIKSALADASPAAFNLIRMILASVLLAIAYHRSLSSIRYRDVAAGATVGLCLAVGYQFQTIGLVHTTPSKSAFITGLVVVLVPLLSVVPALRPPGARAPRWNAFLGAALAFVGILFLTAPPRPVLAAQPILLPNLASINLGDLLTLACSVGFAFHCIALGHASPRVAYRPLAVLQVGFCTLFMAVSLPLIERPFVRPTPRLLTAVVIAAALATAAAFSVQSWAQSVLPPTHTALLLTLEPVFACLTSFLVTGERLGPLQVGGAALILAGIGITELLAPQPVTSAHEA